MRAVVRFTALKTKSMHREFLTHFRNRLRRIDLRRSQKTRPLIDIHHYEPVRVGYIEECDVTLSEERDFKSKNVYVDAI
jgi:hypothetical protein